MHKNREKNAMRREVNRADIGGKSGNKGLKPNSRCMKFRESVKFAV